MENEVRTLNDSYRRVLDSNRRLDEALRYLQDKLIIPYNFTLTSIDEFYDRFTFKHTGWMEAKKTSYQIYTKIHRSWRDYYIIDE